MDLNGQGQNSWNWTTIVSHDQHWMKSTSSVM
jgi:hypothetical protein